MAVIDWDDDIVYAIASDTLLPCLDVFCNRLGYVDKIHITAMRVPP